MANAMIENAIATLAFARQTTLSLFETFPKDKLFHQLTPSGNHAMWILGHLTVSDDGMMVMLDGKKSNCPEDWDKKFGMGSIPTGNASDYPALDEVMNSMADRREALIAWVRSMNEDKLTEQLPEEMRMFAPNFGAFPMAMAWHEGMHAGQLSMLRRDLGLKPMY